MPRCGGGDGDPADELRDAGRAGVEEGDEWARRRPSRAVLVKQALGNIIRKDTLEDWQRGRMGGLRGCLVWGASLAPQIPLDTRIYYRASSVPSRYRVGTEYVVSLSPPKHALE